MQIIYYRADNFWGIIHKDLFKHGQLSVGNGSIPVG